MFRIGHQVFSAAHMLSHWVALSCKGGVVVQSEAKGLPKQIHLGAEVGEGIGLWETASHLVCTQNGVHSGRTQGKDQVQKAAMAQLRS